ncbi:hypothetical protein CEUSTIGMA_g5166.t1 [Chlamydomonas eustigma]|uniref:NF-X1-type domain-containing protein n=1 Tax=Chlamydomonas eustigma TaxID=1157962 RepID=A0A250X3R5_9CHLO|nr:hypothetical protein CEUSTIGMA_g5166.t1 [Chlamydomonas eustigma]|eukprot:GAX77723.1 hypothetical protein CEUSTIGMA_g5166.t1 [Chlamydomonas eustigma]
MPRVGSRNIQHENVREDGKMFDNYIHAAEGHLSNEDLLSDQVFTRGLERVKEYLGAAQEDGGACLICLGQIKPTEAVWDCQQGCYAVMHINCIQDWARSQIDAVAARLASNTNNESVCNGQKSSFGSEWGCPKCRQTYKSDEIPSTYYCFCKKEANPVWDPWIAPHSCGELCSKSLQSGCGHSCLLLCHPGPCPPCPLVVNSACYCGRMIRKRRCGNNAFSCGSVCGRRLECGHPCLLTCHEGDCPPCKKIGYFKCACSAEERQLSCGERLFQCGRVCGHALSCGHHKCDKICHAGPCGSCVLEGSRACPCGKTQFPDLTCADKVPTCSETCGRLLTCGVHKCEEKCHNGACPQTCKSVVVKSCRCGKMQKEVLCHTELTCERRCNNMRSCGRHACKRRCCTGQCSPCEEVCGRKLRCGNHKCQAPCHSGPCRPCPLTLVITCACGSAKSTIPCGAEIWAVPPRCSNECPVPQLCRHASTHAGHRCHYGQCPPCPDPCYSQLPCGHTCSSPHCHDPPTPAVADFKRPAPPAASALLQFMKSEVGNHQGQTEGSQNGSSARTAYAVISAIVSAQQMQRDIGSSCPPCMAPVPVTCLGRHKEVLMPCYQAEPFSCEVPCGCSLPCGNHTCSLPCHAIPQSQHGVGIQSQPCEPCTRRCIKARPCNHACPLPCHTGQCPPCMEPLSEPCHCGRASIRLMCHQFQHIVPAAGQVTTSSGHLLCCGKPCHRPLLRCPHPCREKCHEGPCPGSGQGCEEEVTVRCACKRLKAKWTCKAVLTALETMRGSGGSPTTYDALSAPRVLPCDHECLKPKEASKESAKEVPSSAQHGDASIEGPSYSLNSLKLVAREMSEAVGLPLQVPTSAIATVAAKQRLNKAEREALAATEALRREVERIAARRKQIALQIVGWLLIVFIGVVLGVYGQPLLVLIDAHLRGSWKFD